mgnify:CR=1 FL=1
MHLIFLDGITKELATKPVLGHLEPSVKILRCSAYLLSIRLKVSELMRCGESDFVKFKDRLVSTSRGNRVQVGVLGRLMSAIGMLLSLASFTRVATLSPKGRA